MKQLSGRNSRSEVPCKATKFTEQHLSQNLFLNKVSLLVLKVRKEISGSSELYLKPGRTAAIGF